MKKLLTLLFIGIASLYAQTVPSYVPTNGLVGWWPFNGNANDESGNGNNGSYVAGVNPTSDRNGTSNSAMGFSGQGSITLSNLPTTGSQDFTIAGWLSTSNASTARKGIACWGQDIPWQSTYFFVNTNGKLAFDFAYNAGPTSTASVNDAQWHFISVTNSNGFIQLYVDGVPNGQGMQMSLPNITGNTKSIGSNLSGGGTQNNFAGKLDDIAIWDRALTSSEIQNIYNQINTNTSLPTYVPSNGLVGWWPFNGNANDESGYGNNGSVNGSILTSGRDGSPNTAYGFNGSSNTIDLPLPFFGGGQQTKFTFHTKLLFNSTTNAPNIWGKTLFWGEVNFSIGSNNEIRFVWANSISGNKYSVIESQPNVIQTGQWYSIDIVYQNSTAQIYLNGLPITTNLKWVAQGGSVISTSQIEASCNFNQIANSSKFGLRYTGGSPGNYFFGSMDEFGIWNRPLSQNEIVSLHISCPDSVNVQPQNFTAYSSTGWANFKCESSDTAATYQWQQSNGAGWLDLTNLGNYFGATSDSLVITGVTASMNNYGYRCIVTGCTSDTSDVAVLTVANGIGLGESMLDKLTISPNPTNGLVSLNISVVGNYELLTIDGRVLESGTAKKDYDLTTYPKGLYHLRLSTDEGSRVLKVVKN